jgi:hypothetical protein
LTKELPVMYEVQNFPDKIIGQLALKAKMQMK